MTKNFSPKILRLIFVLILLLQSFVVVSQSNVYINVNWASYSGENKIEPINSSNSVGLSFDHNYTTTSNTNFLNKNSSTVSLPYGDYTVKVYDYYGDDWNGSNPSATIFVDGIEKYSFNGNFTNNSGSAYTEITMDFPLSINSLDDAFFSYSNQGTVKLNQTQHQL